MNAFDRHKIVRRNGHNGTVRESDQRKWHSTSIQKSIMDIELATSVVLSRTEQICLTVDHTLELTDFTFLTPHSARIRSHRDHK